MPASREAFRVPCFLTWPPSNAPVEPGEATARVPSVAYGLGVTKRPSGACSASTWPIFRWFYQIVKLAQKVPFGLQLADAGSLCNPRVPETLLQSWDAAPDTSARTSRRPTEAVAGAAPLGTWRRSDYVSRPLRVRRHEVQVTCYLLTLRLRASSAAPETHSHC